LRFGEKLLFHGASTSTSVRLAFLRFWRRTALPFPDDADPLRDFRAAASLYFGNKTL
jgi:hypothetical protein